MADPNNIPPKAPTGGGGPGNFCNASPHGTNPKTDKWSSPCPHGTGNKQFPEKLTINGTIAAGGPLSASTIKAINDAAIKTPKNFRRYIAYAEKVKVGGSLAWRANNPGNLRNASNKIAVTPGAAGNFAVFATKEDGITAQRDLYLNKYGNLSAREAIWNPKTKMGLTPPSENDTDTYLVQLENEGVKLDDKVNTQIDIFMKAIKKHEGNIEGIEIIRTP